MSDLPTLAETPPAAPEADPPVVPGVGATEGLAAPADAARVDSASDQPVNNPSAYTAAPSTATSAQVAVPPSTDNSTVSPEPIDPVAEANKVGFDVRFLDFSGKPIADLQHKVVITENGKRLEFPGISDAAGNGIRMSGMEILTPLELWVRKDDGSYVIKHKGTVGCADLSLCAVSPHIKIKVGTEIHAGSPGTLPAKPVAGDPTVEKRPNAPTSQAMGGKLPDPSLSPQRNAKGNPVATATTPSNDANDRNRLPTLGLFSWGSSSNAGSIATTPQKVPPLPSGMRVDAAKVADVLKAMEQQVTWDWVKLKAIYGTSGGIKIAMAAKTFDYSPETKEPGQFKGQCYSSVKVGLWRAGLVEGVEGGVYPSTMAKPWLLSQGFAEVTAHVPDARWAAPGDVITYRYDDATIAANQAKIASALKQYDADLKDYPAKKQAYEDEHKAWLQRRAAPSLAQLSTASGTPGKKKAKAKDPEPKPPKAPEQPQGENYGHIDVRGYDGYFSDAKALKVPSAVPHGSHKGFVVNGIFRKIYDDQPDLRVRAFLKCIREWECHEEQDDAQRYFMLYSPINGMRRFSDVSGHPFENIETDHSPAGAYQIRLATYHDNVMPNGDIQAGFSPTIQDRIAVRLIEGRGALGLIRSGKIMDAIPLLVAEWSSLPGSRKHPRQETRNKETYVFTAEDFCSAHAAFMKEIAR